LDSIRLIVGALPTREAGLPKPSPKGAPTADHDELHFRARLAQLEFARAGGSGARPREPVVKSGGANVSQLGGSVTFFIDFGQRLILHFVFPFFASLFLFSFLLLRGEERTVFGQNLAKLWPKFRLSFRPKTPATSSKRSTQKEQQEGGLGAARDEPLLLDLGPKRVGCQIRMEPSCSLENFSLNFFS